MHSKDETCVYCQNIEIDPEQMANAVDVITNLGPIEALRLYHEIFMPLVEEIDKNAEPPKTKEQKKFWQEVLSIVESVKLIMSQVESTDGHRSEDAN